MKEGMMDDVLRRLDDENEIRRLVLTFSVGMDLRDEQMFRSAFADQVDLDIPPRAKGAITLQGLVDADTYAKEVIRLVGGWQATQHVNTNHLIRVDGDEATCQCYVFATHFMGPEHDSPWLVAGSRYSLDARRFAGVGWRFVKFRSTPMWSNGDRGLWEEIARRIAL
jgi:hypothetical protein